MSDFFHFVCWFVCVFTSALCMAMLTGDHLYFQTAARSIFLSLCVSLMLGSVLFLGIWKLCVGVGRIRMQTACKAIR
jgi:hypothetical protein